jgi:hypothetical protein
MLFGWGKPFPLPSRPGPIFTLRFSKNLFYTSSLFLLPMTGSPAVELKSW